MDNALTVRNYVSDMVLLIIKYYITWFIIVDNHNVRSAVKFR